MKKVLSVLATSLLLTGTAFASSNIEPNDVPFQSSHQASQSRAQVKADLAQARSQGLIINTETGYPHASVNENGIEKSRTQVRQELEQSKIDGSYYNPLVNGAWIFKS